jgi:hypothetical protein
MGVPHAGHASKGSSTLELRVGVFFFIGHLFVKRDDDALRADQDLDVQGLAADLREEHVEPFACPLRPQPSAVVGCSEPLEKLAGVGLVETYFEGSKLRKGFEGEPYPAACGNS